MHTHAGSTLHNLVIMACDLLTSGSKNAEVMLYSICAPSSALIDQVVFFYSIHRHIDTVTGGTLPISSTVMVATARISTLLGSEWTRLLRALVSSAHSRRVHIRYIYTAAPHSCYTIQQAGTCLPHKKFPFSWEVDVPRLIHNSIGQPSLQPKQHLD